MHSTVLVEILPEAAVARVRDVPVQWLMPPHIVLSDFTVRSCTEATEYIATVARLYGASMCVLCAEAAVDIVGIFAQWKEVPSELKPRLSNSAESPSGSEFL